MNIHILKSKKEASLYASAKIIHQIHHKPNSVLGLSTGNTMISIYNDLVHAYKNHMTAFVKVKTFNVDEYADISRYNKNSFFYFMNKYLFSKTDIKLKNTNFPIETNSKSYDKIIKESGGLDLLILGIGRNGHIAFNEPGKSSNLSSKTRKIILSDETIKVNKLHRKNITHAYTVGISTILKAKKIVIVAFGKEKSNAVYNLVNGKMGYNNPSAFLRDHNNFMLILDQDAARLLSIR